MFIGFEGAVFLNNGEILANCLLDVAGVRFEEVS